MTTPEPPLFITDAQVRATLGLSDTYSAMEQTFRSYGLKLAANLPRTRVPVQDATLSTLGAVLLDGPVPMMGVKTYPSLGGQFNLMIQLTGTDLKKCCW